MLKLERTSSTNPHFLELIKALDLLMKQIDGEDHAFFAQFNSAVSIKYVVLLYNDDTPIGCGAIREYDLKTMEIKRMYVVPSERGKGVASQVLDELEKWANELGFNRCILETTVKQPDAIRLYQKNNYFRIPNFGQYDNVETSVCFEKWLL